MVVYFGAGLVVLWLVASLTLIVFTRTLIYNFRPGISASTVVGIPRATAITFAAADNTQLTAWVVPPSAGRPVILYFMGNGGSLPSDGPRLSEFVNRGFGVAAMNYRGAGGAPGKPTQEALTSDAIQFYDALDTLIGQPVAPEDRIIYGSSLGAAVSVQLAARREAAALILEAPFNRMCEVASHRFRIFPACLMLPYEHWASADLIGKITAPVLILHGDADKSIPLSQGRALFDAANQPKRLIVYPGGNHNDLRLYGAGIEIINFIQGLARN